MERVKLIEHRCICGNEISHEIETEMGTTLGRFCRECASKNLAILRADSHEREKRQEQANGANEANKGN